jgi:hypothetical protein
MAGPRVKISFSITSTFAGVDSNWYLYKNEVGLLTNTVYCFRNSNRGLDNASSAIYCLIT